MLSTFITFGGGGKNYIDAGNRLVGQAKSLELFDNIVLYTDDYLKNDIEFWKQHHEFIEKNRRGYGYWIWKPYIVKKTLEMMKNNDILMYLDCGCEIDYRKKNIFKKNFKLVETVNLIGEPVLVENQYNKMDLVLHLDMLSDKYLKTPQLQGCVWIMLVCDKTRNLVNTWYDLACNYHMIDDTPSISKNLDCFIEHRHDQSVLSLLAKKYDLFNTEHTLHDCVEIIRNRTGISRLK